MTTYETLSIGVSIVALIVSIAIPLISFVRNKLVRPKLSVLPFDYQPLSLQFNSNLSWFSFNFSILCEKAPCVVSSIKAVVSRSSDGSEMQFRWSWLQPLWSNWASGNGALAFLNSATAAKPIRLQAETLEPLLVNFEDEDQELVDKYRLAQNCFDGISDTRPSTYQEENLFIESVKASDGFRDVCQSAQDGFFWLAGQYVLKLVIQYDAHKAYTQLFPFRISADEEACLKDNINRIVFSNLCPLHYPGNTCQAVFKDIDM